MSREMLKMLKLQGKVLEGGGGTEQWPSKLQHLQHLPCFKHIYTRNWGNVKDCAILRACNFNISPVLSTFHHKMLTTGEMLKILKLENPKLQYFPGNVEDVEVAGDMFSPPPPPKISLATSTSSTFPGKC